MGMRKKEVILQQGKTNLYDMNLYIASKLEPGLFTSTLRKKCSGHIKNAKNVE